jgi:methyl-accepting chemotaxis protein
MKHTPSTAKFPLSIGRRIFAGGSLLFLIFFILGANAHISILKVDAIVDEMRKDRMPKLVDIAEADQYFMRCYANLLMSKDGNTPADRLAFIASANEHLKKAAARLKSYEANITADDERASFQQLMDNLSAYLEKRKVYVELVKTDSLTEAAAYLRTDIEPSNAIMRANLDQKLSANLSSGQAHLKEASQTVEATLRNAVLIFTGGAVLFAFIGTITVRNINRSLKKISSGIDDSSQQLLQSSQQSSASSQSLAEGSSQQAASLEEISASIEELSSMTKRNAENALAGKTASNQARVSAEAGASEMEGLQTAMNAIQKSSTEIGKIIKTIDEIAFQTNILALNAAVEAARAGEAGAGFAVVAEEVRSLAQRSAVAAKETAVKIAEASTRSEQGVQLTLRVAGGLQQILNQNREVDRLISEVAGASAEQSEGLSQINMAVSQLDKVTQSNAACAEETAAAAQDLNSRSTELSNASRDLARLVGTSQIQAPAPTTEPAGASTFTSTKRAHLAPPAKDRSLPPSTKPRTISFGNPAMSLAQSSNSESLSFRD